MIFFIHPRHYKLAFFVLFLGLFIIFHGPDTKVSIKLWMRPMHAAAASTFYVDPLFTGGGNNGTANNPDTSLNWSRYNTALASGPVTVYVSARPASTDTDTVLTGAFNSGSRTDTSTNVITFVGGYEIVANHHTFVNTSGFANALYNSNANTATTPVWSSYTGNSKMEFDGTGAFNAPCSTSSNTQGYINIVGVKFVGGTGGQPMVMNRNHDIVFDAIEWTNLGGATPTSGPGLIIGCSNLGTQGVGGYGGINIEFRNFWGHDTYGEAVYIGGFYGCDEHGDTQTNCPNGVTPGSISFGSGGSCYGSGKWAGDNIVFHNGEIDNGGEYGGERENEDDKDCLFDIVFHDLEIYHTDECPTCKTDGASVCLQFNSAAIAYNIFCHDVGSIGIQFTNFYNGYTGYFGDEAHGSSNLVGIYNNIIVNSAMNTGYGYGYGIGYNTCDATCQAGAVFLGAAFVNNTFFDVVKGATSGNAIFVGGALNTIANMQNNIAALSGGANFTSGSGSLTGGTHGHNDWYATSGTNVSYASSFTCATIASFESTSVCATPVFVSTSTPYQDVNFKLQGSSTILAAGTNLTSSCSGLLAHLCTDYFGTTRSATGAWAPGAYSPAGGSTAPVAPSGVIFAERNDHEEYSQEPDTYRGSSFGRDRR